MANIFKEIVQIEYKGDMTEPNKLLDQQLQRVIVLEKRYEKLNKMRVSTPGLAVDPQFVKVLNDVEKQFIKIRGEAAKTIATNEQFNKSLIGATNRETAASLRLTSLQRLNRTLPNERISTEISKIQSSGVGSINLQAVKDIGAGLLLDQLAGAAGAAGELGTAIGAINPLLGAAAGAAAVLGTYLLQDTEYMKQARIETQALNEGFISGQNAANLAGQEVARLTQLINASKEGFIDKEAVLNRYNETMGKVVGNATSLQEAEALIIKQGEAYVKAMQLRATANAFFAVSQKALEKSVEAQFNIDTKDVTFFDRVKSFGEAIIASENKTGFGGSITKGVEQFDKSLQKAQDEYDTKTAVLQKNISNRAEELGRTTIEELIKFAKDNGLNIEEILGLKTDEVKPKVREIENVFVRELSSLRDKIASAQIRIEISPELIEEKFEKDLEKELARLENFFKKKQLTGPQLETLKKLAAQLNSIELQKGLKDYNDQVENSLRDLDDKIRSLQEESVRKNIGFIQDVYQREIAGIQNEFAKSNAELDKQRRDLLKKADDDLKKFTDPAVQEAIKERIKQINIAYVQLKTDVETEKFKKLEEAATRAFERIKQKTQEASTIAEQFRDRQLQQAVEEQLTSFVNGQQNRLQTTRNINLLQRDAAVDQLRIQLASVEKQRLLNVNRVATSEEELDKLNIENARLDNTIAKLRAQILELTGAQKEEDVQRVLEKFKIANEIANLITDALSQIVSAQERQVDREIAVQEKRIERLKEVADRGNAEMLEMEEKRLRQNQALKERYARQQIALQLIQQGAALSLGIAQATAVPWPANIPAIASTIAAATAGFALIRQLNQPVQGFKDGVVDFRGRGSERSDSNLVKISNRESVMTAQATAANKDILIQMNKGRKFVTADSLSGDSKNDNKIKMDIKNLTEEVKMLRQDVKQSKGTQVFLDKRGIASIVEEVFKLNIVKWKL